MMRVLAVLLAGGCNQVYDIETTVLLPDPILDSDGDGHLDGEDNCPDVPNDQTDDDEDTVGNACDNCPLVANALQGATGDADAIGDACDPRPAADGDCLILYDTFDTPLAFEAHWRWFGSPSTTFEPATGHVTIRGGPSETAFLVLDDAGNLLDGVFSVQRTSTSKMATIRIACTSSRSPTRPSRSSRTAPCSRRATRTSTSHRRRTATFCCPRVTRRAEACSPICSLAVR